MTDLERLKGMYLMRPEEQGWRIIDAHLKEDAERDAKCRRVDHAEANLEKEVEFSHKLLTELAEKEALLKECVGSAGYEVLSRLTTELAELRAENTRLNYELGVADYPGKKQLVAELTEAKEAAVGFMAERDELEAKLTELREAVKAVTTADWSDLSVSKARWDRLRQLIEEKP